VSHEVEQKGENTMKPPAVVRRVQIPLSQQRERVARKKAVQVRNTCPQPGRRKRAFFARHGAFARLADDKHSDLGGLAANVEICLSDADKNGVEWWHYYDNAPNE
jgi:hypothetical protein